MDLILCIHGIIYLSVVQIILCGSARNKEKSRGQEGLTAISGHQCHDIKTN